MSRRIKKINVTPFENPARAFVVPDEPLKGTRRKVARFFPDGRVIDFSRQKVAGIASLILAACLFKAGATGVLNPPPLPIDATSLGGHPARDYILSGSKMDFDGGLITSDGNGQMTLSRQGDDLTITESDGVWRLSYHGGAISFFPDGSIGADANAGTFFQAGGDGIGAIGNDSGRLEYGGTEGNTDPGLYMNGFEFLDPEGNLKVNNIGGGLWFNGNMYGAVDIDGTLEFQDF